MPNRIIKESIRTSETIASLSDFEFRLWIGLIVSADDAGRGDARPAIIKGLVFPLRDRITARDIDAALHGLAAKGCISLYAVDGKPYFWFPSWAEHQRIRDCKPKYPAPPDPAACCGELPQVAADSGLARAPAESESESEYESESKIVKGDKRQKFIPPTLDEVKDYAKERNSAVNPEKFWEYFNAGDWKDAKGQPVRNWKQKFLTWEKYDHDQPRPTMAKPGQTYAEDPEKVAQKMERLKKLTAAMGGS